MFLAIKEAKAHGEAKKRAQVEARAEERVAKNAATAVSRPVLNERPCTPGSSAHRGRNARARARVPRRARARASRASKRSCSSRTRSGSRGCSCSCGSIDRSSRRKVARARELLVRRGKRRAGGVHHRLARVLRACFSRSSGRARAAARDRTARRPRARERAKEHGLSSASRTLARARAASRSRSQRNSSFPRARVARRRSFRPRARNRAGQRRHGLAATLEFVEGDGPEALAPSRSLRSRSSPIRPTFDAFRRAHARAGRARLTSRPSHSSLRPTTATTGCAVCARPRLKQLTPSGVALIELGLGQAERALPIAAQAQLVARTHKDYGGIERVLELSR
jgi:hypothetical protein